MLRSCKWIDGNNEVKVVGIDYKDIKLVEQFDNETCTVVLNLNKRNQVYRIYHKNASQLITDVNLAKNGIYQN